MKARMGVTHFLTKTLSILAYSLTRIMNIVGIKPRIAAIAACLRLTLLSGTDIL
jgi:transposase